METNTNINTNASKGNTRALLEIWKDGFNPKQPWLVQMPKGRLGFRTKRQAKGFVDANVRLASKYGSVGGITLEKMSGSK